MDIHETARRLWSRWPVIAALLAAGALAGLALHITDETRYTSTARVLAADNAFTTPDALADEMLAVATTPTRLETAITETGADRTPAQVADYVAVEPLGGSPVLALSVTAPDAEEAAALANSLAAHSVETLGPRATDDVAESSVTDRPAIIEQARPAASPDPSRRIPDTLLGLFLGLIAGVGLAAALEMLRPTLIGPRCVAEAFSTRPLGQIAPVETAAGGGGLISPMIATTIGCAASQADVRTVWLVAVDPLVNVEPLAQDLRASLPRSRPEDDASAETSGFTPRVEVWAPHREVFPDADGKWSGLVIIAPPRISQVRIQPVREIVGVVSLPVLGLIAYEP